MNNIKKIVLTVGPCAGKTTALVRIIEHFSGLGYKVFTIPEVPTMFTQAGMNYLTDNAKFFYEEDLKISLDEFRERLAKVAVAMGVDTTGMSTDEAADAAIAAVKQLSADVNIPHVCEAMKADEIEVLAKDAMADACFPGNPREATLDDVIELFKKICPAA